VPSWTAALWDLGLGTSIVGRTRYCIHPEPLASSGIPRIGGTKDVRLERVLALMPDLVVTNDEENTPDTLAALTSELGTDRVFRSFPRTSAEALADLRRLAEVCGASPRALQDALSRIQQSQDALRAATAETPRLHHLYLIWQEPWMAAGHTSYIAHLLSEGGFESIIRTGSAPEDRYPTVTPEHHGNLLKQHGQHGFVLLSTEPYPFKDKHTQNVAQAWGCPTEQCLLVDGRALSWYGTLMAEGYDEVLRIRQRCLEIRACHMSAE
jgi:ABC-type Fe3+-hydroxamate transport system substrate-binding protein